MSNITRDVILDLLPLYLANEVSADTRLLVASFLEQDPTLARIAEQSHMVFTDDAPIPVSKETEMETYKETKKLMFWRTAIIAGVAAFALFVFLILSLGALLLLII